MHIDRAQSVAEFMQLALDCVLAAVVSGLLSALTLTGIVLLLSGSTLGLS